MDFVLNNNDLLNCIFKQLWLDPDYKHTYTEYWRSTIDHDRQLMGVLAQVCKRWRRLVYSKAGFPTNAYYHFCNNCLCVGSAALFVFPPHGRYHKRIGISMERRGAHFVYGWRSNREIVVPPRSKQHLETIRRVQFFLEVFGRFAQK